MRDIRPDLRERLEAIAAQRREQQQKLSELDAKEANYKALLAEEDARWELIQPALFPNADGIHLDIKPTNLVVGRTPLARFLVRALSDRKSHTLDELVDAAHAVHLDFGTKNPGRSIHFALTGLRQNGFVTRSVLGRWSWAGEEQKP